MLERTDAIRSFAKALLRNVGRPHCGGHYERQVRLARYHSRQCQPDSGLQRIRGGVGVPLDDTGRGMTEKALWGQQTRN